MILCVRVMVNMKLNINNKRIVVVIKSYLLFRRYIDLPSPLLSKEGKKHIITIKIFYLKLI